MFSGTMDNLGWMMIGSAFALVLSIWLIGVLLWSVTRSTRTRKLEQRLGLIEDEEGNAPHVLRLWHDGEEATTTVQNQVSRRNLFALWEHMRRDADYQAPLVTILLALFGVTVLMFVIPLVLMGSVVVAGACAATTVAIFWFYTKIRIDSHKATFESQFVEALGLAARSLRAGHPLLGAFRLAADEMSPPVSDVFAEICQQQSLGISIEEALRRASRKSNSDDLRLFATAVIIQLRSGGNLADLMDRLAYVIRDRMRLTRRVRVLTAQTQLSKRVLVVLPFIVFLGLNLLNAEYMEPLYNTSLGQMLLGIAGVSLILGVWTMNHMAVLKY